MDPLSRTKRQRRARLEHALLVFSLYDPWSHGASISGVRGVNNRSGVFSERLAHGYLSVRQRTGLRTRRLPGLAADGFLCGSSPRAHANQQPDIAFIWE